MPEITLGWDNIDVFSIGTLLAQYCTHTLYIQHSWKITHVLHTVNHIAHFNN